MILPGDSTTAIVDALVDHWIPFFQKADYKIEWLAAEKEHSLRLDDKTVLVGRVDAIGKTGDDFFFGEWKSQAPPPKYKAEDWKQEWRLNPQSLTYGVLVDSLYPGTRRFTVRKAFKSSPPTFDYEWFKYSDDEIAWWYSKLVEFAREIRSLRALGKKPWNTNLTACFRYGPKYVCPYFNPACSQLNWSSKLSGFVSREVHLEVEKEIIEYIGESDNPAGLDSLVILDATRVDDYLVCPEKYRRAYEEGLREPPSEAIIIGKGMHELLGRYYNGLISKGKS